MADLVPWISASTGESWLSVTSLGTTNPLKTMPIPVPDITRPIAWPFSSMKSMPSTAFNVPSCVLKYVLRPWTSSKAIREFPLN